MRRFLNRRVLACCAIGCLFASSSATVAADEWGGWGGWKKYTTEHNGPVRVCVKAEKCECKVTQSTSSSLDTDLQNPTTSRTLDTVEEAAARALAAGEGEASLACTWILISTGNPRVDSLLGSGFFRIWADIPTPSLWTPQGLRYVRGGYGIHGLDSQKTSGGVPQQVYIINPQGLIVMFKFADNESIGLPWGSTKDEDATRVLMVDAEGWATTNNPAYYDLHTGGGDLYRFVAAPNSADYLQLVKYRSVRGREETIEDWDNEVVWDENGILRQVKSPMGLSDILVANDHKYAINFYKMSDIQSGKDTNGYYVTVTGAVPLAVWTFENPEPSTMKKLRVSKASGAKTNVSDYVYTDANKEWQLTTGAGLKTESADELWSDDEQYMISTTIVRGPDNMVVSKATQKYQAYLRIEDVLDPDGLALKTEYDYYSNAAEANRYTKPKSEKYPGGNWVYWDYDSAGRKSVQIRPWKDSVFGSNAAVARATYYDYTPVATGDGLIFNDQRPRTVTETVLGTIVFKTYHAYVTNAVGELSEVVEHCAETNAAYGASGNPRSVTTYYGTNVSPLKVSLLKSQVSPDGQIVTYDYEYGTFHASNAAPANSWFEVDPNGSCVRRTVTGGTTNSPLGIAFKTRRSVTVFDSSSHPLFEETYVYASGTDYERTSWHMPEYDDYFHVIKVRSSDGQEVNSTWGSNCCGKESDKDASGVEHAFDYDLLNRVITATKKGTSSPTGDVKTETTYDAADRRLTTKTSGGSLSLVASSNTYNLAGHVVSSVDSLGLVATYAQTGGGRTNTVVRPGGITNVAVSYLDGKTKFTTENGVIKSWQDYGVNADGSQWTITYTGPAGTNSPVWQKTVTDLIGRTVRAERPGFGGVVVTNLFTHNSKGQLVKTQASGVTPQPSATFYEYNELGEQIRSGLDVDGNGVLDLASNDRITESSTFYEQDPSNDWWRVSVSKLYAIAGSSEPTTNSIQKTRLTGLGVATGNGLLTTDSRSLDILGNETTSRTEVDRDTKTVTQTTDTPDSTVDPVSVSVNGLMLQAVSTTGLTNLFLYDALERQTGVTDSRTGTSVTHYNSKGQVDWVEDAASNRTWLAYDPDTGRQIATTNALGNAVYTHYSVEGQVLATWGATYPVMYEFDDFNRMTALYALRDTALSLASFADFCSNLASFDKTSWLYDQATGLLTNKVYADGKGPVYSYTEDGKLATRTWARGITTTYSYTNTGEMVGIDYSDSTPDVSFTFNRLGQPLTIADGQGTRTFTYDDSLQLAAETNAVGLLSRTYDSLGRNSGFELWNGGTRSVASVYGYSDLGRFASLSSVVGGQTNSWSYSYLQNSDLLSAISNPQYAINTTKAYEPSRDLLTSVDNRTNGATVSRFDYQNDALARRTQRIDSGSAAATNAFAYDSLSQLTNAIMGANAFAWTFDPIGNRVNDTSNSLTHNYTANALNQYTQITNGGLVDLTWDVDGNLTNDSVFAYTWNGENQLSGASRPGMVASYSYDYQGRRSQKIVNGVTNTFLWDGWLLAQEVPSDGVTNSYAWGDDLSGTFQGAGGIGGLLSVTRSTPSGTATYYPYSDGNGNITDYVDTNGVVVAHREYDAYGNTLVATGSMVNEFDFWFSTKYLDSETGLYYYGSRLYNPGIGKWISRDPIGEQERDQSFYLFCANSPMDRIDVNGLSWLLTYWFLHPKNGISLANLSAVADDVVAIFEQYDITIQITYLEIEETYYGLLDNHYMRDLPSWVLTPEERDDTFSYIYDHYGNNYVLFADNMRRPDGSGLSRSGSSGPALVDLGATPLPANSRRVARVVVHEILTHIEGNHGHNDSDPDDMWEDDRAITDRDDPASKTDEMITCHLARLWLFPKGATDVDPAHILELE